MVLLLSKKEIISIQDYLERIKNLSKEGNKCEKHEINALDISCSLIKNCFLLH